jgi:HIV-1 Vpr-binding protein
MSLIAGELVLWGATLWDPRVPAPLHTFDQLSAGGAGGCFHPGGAEIILNSEVWDLRTRKLLRSVPLLDGTSVTFNSSEWRPSGLLVALCCSCMHLRMW